MSGSPPACYAFCLGKVWCVQAGDRVNASGRDVVWRFLLPAFCRRMSCRCRVASKVTGCPSECWTCAAASQKSCERIPRVQKI